MVGRTIAKLEQSAGNPTAPPLATLILFPKSSLVHLLASCTVNNSSRLRACPTISKLKALRRNTPQNSKRDELLLLINSLNPIITVETTEEERLEGLLRSISVTASRPTLHLERHRRPRQTQRLAALRHGPARTSSRQYRAHRRRCHLSAPRFCPLLRQRPHQPPPARSRRPIPHRASVHHHRRSRNRIATRTERRFSPFQLGLPDANELALCVNQVLTETSRDHRALMTLDAPAIAQLAKNLVGLTKDEATRTLRRCLLARGVADAALLDAVLDAKRAALQADGVLEPVRRDTTFTRCRRTQTFARVG